MLQENLITKLTVFLEGLEEGHSSVILPLPFHLSPSRMIHSTASIDEAVLSIDVSIVFLPACHIGLWGQRA